MTHQCYIWQPDQYFMNTVFLKWTGSWNLSDYNKLEFWIYSDYPGKPSDFEYLEVILVTDFNFDGTYRGYLARIDLDFSAYWRHVVLYFGNNATIGDPYYFSRYNNPIHTYSSICGLIIRRKNNDSADFSKIKIRMSPIKASSDKWLWGNGPDAFSQTAFTNIRNNQIANGDWGPAYTALRNEMKTAWQSNSYNTGPNNSFSPGNHPEVSDYYRYYNWKFLDGTAHSFREESAPESDYGNIDWTTFETSNPGENGFLNRHNKIILYTAEHYYAGQDYSHDYIYQQRCREFIDSWIEDATFNWFVPCWFPIYGPTIKPDQDEWFPWNSSLQTIWSGIATGMRVDAWLKVLDYDAQQSPFPSRTILSRELFVSFMKALYNQAKWIDHVRTSQTLNDWGNHQAWAAGALYAFADRFPWFTNATQNFREHAFDTTSRKRKNYFPYEQVGLVLYRDNNPDRLGGTIEMGSHYHIINLLGLNLIKFNRQWGEPSLDDRFVNQWNETRFFLKSITKPRLNFSADYFPDFHDAEYNEPISKYGSIDLSGVPLLDHPLFLDLSDQVVFRNSPANNAFYLFMDAGPYGTGAHQHQDKLSICVNALGFDWIVDSAGYGDRFSDYDHTKYHNSVVYINGVSGDNWLGQFRDGNSDEHAFEYNVANDCNCMTKNMSGTNPYVEQCAKYPGFFEVTRRVEFQTTASPQKFVITDEFWTNHSTSYNPLSGTTRKYRILFHFPPELENRFRYGYDPDTGKWGVAVYRKSALLRMQFTNMNLDQITNVGISTESGMIYIHEKGDNHHKTTLAYEIWTTDTSFSVTTEVWAEQLILDGSVEIETIQSYLENTPNLTSNVLNQLVTAYEENDHSEATIHSWAQAIHHLDPLIGAEEVPTGLYNSLLNLLTGLDLNMTSEGPFCVLAGLQPVTEFYSVVHSNSSNKSPEVVSILRLISALQAAMNNHDFTTVLPMMTDLKERIEQSEIGPDLIETLLNECDTVEQRIRYFLTYFDLFARLGRSMNESLNDVGTDINIDEYLFDEMSSILNNVADNATGRDYEACVQNVMTLQRLIGNSGDHLLRENWNIWVRNMSDILETIDRSSSINGFSDNDEE